MTVRHSLIFCSRFTFGKNVGFACHILERCELCRNRSETAFFGAWFWLRTFLYPWRYDMRKILIAILVLLTLLCFVACNDTSLVTCSECGYKNASGVKFCSDCGASIVTSNSDNNNGNSTSCQHSFGGWQTKVSANCTTDGTDERICTKCSYKETKSTSSLGHTTSTGICSRCNENFGGWEIRYYVDEFNRPTDEMYITNTDWIIGTFSNSATNNSLLKAKILVDNLDGPRVSIILYEYGSNQVKSYYEATYNITLLDTSDVKHNLKGIMYDGGDRVRLYVSYGGYDYISMMINALLEPGEVSLYMVESKYTVNEYLFNVETSNFSELYEKLIGSDSNNSSNGSNSANNSNADISDFEGTWHTGYTCSIDGGDTYFCESFTIDGFMITTNNHNKNEYFGASTTNAVWENGAMVIYGGASDWYTKITYELQYDIMKVTVNWGDGEGETIYYRSEDLNESHLPK